MIFDEKAKDWLARVEKQNQEFYQASWDVFHCGIVFPMRQIMQIETQHAVLSISTKLGKMGIGSEYCYFAICTKLDKSVMKEYFRLLSDLEQSDVDCKNRKHDYTFISLVVLTESFDDPVLKRMLRRYRHMTTYHKKDKKYGWSICQMAVVDLTSGETYGSAMASSLIFRLSGKTHRNPGLLEACKKFFPGVPEKKECG